MNNGEKRREKIFGIYSDQLKLLVAEGFVDKKYEQVGYICPICLGEYPSINTEENALTLEDAPPKSLGGTANVLTCKKCNNTSGHKIDYHLTERLRELDSQKFLPGTEMKVKIKIEDVILNASIIVEEDGTMKIHHSNKNNHPEKLAEAMKKVKSGIVLNPEDRIYPEGFWFTPPYPKELAGAYFVMNKGMESLLVIFPLTTDHTEHVFATILPLPTLPLQEVITQINKEFQVQGGSFNLELYPLEQDNADYIEKMENIKAMNEWIEKRIKKSE